MRTLYGACLSCCSIETRSSFDKSPQDALKPYVKLQELVFALKQAQPAAEDAAPHLVDHVELTTKSLWEQMKEAFVTKFDITLRKMKWPNKDASLQGSIHTEWAEGVERLLELQGPELESQEKKPTATKRRQEPLVLLPLEAMVKPLELRFRYHFEGDKPTNRLDKVGSLLYCPEFADIDSRSTFSLMLLAYCIRMKTFSQCTYSQYCPHIFEDPI